jgi:hypothetical protein
MLRLGSRGEREINASHILALCSTNLKEIGRMIRCVRIWTAKDGNSEFEEGTIDLSMCSWAAVTVINLPKLPQFWRLLWSIWVHPSMKGLGDPKPGPIAAREGRYDDFRCNFAAHLRSEVSQTAALPPQSGSSVG